MLSALKNANSILLCTHVSPDGDAIGSLLYAGAILRTMGKQVTMSCSDLVPARYMFLEAADQICLPEALNGRSFDLAFSLDAGDLNRIGACAEAYLKAPVTVQLDHHGTNPAYAMYNEIDFEAAATACIVYRMMLALGIKLTEKMAEYLYTAVSSDTGNFAFQNTDAEAFYVMAACMEAGLPLAVLSRRLNLVREKEHVALLGRALNTLHFFAGGHATGMRLTREDYAACAARPEHSDKIVNYGLDMDDVLITYFADDREEGKTKFSLRAQPPCSVGALAVSLGGGGHEAAAGCTLALPMDEACAVVEEKITQEIEKRMNG